MKIRTAFIYLLLATSALFAQPYRISGTVYDNADRKPLISATVKLIDARENSEPRIFLTDRSGKFEFSNVRRGMYVVEVSFIGYNSSSDTVRAFRNQPEPLTVYLVRGSVQMDPLQVIGNAIPAEQKEDTVQYNASAFKVTKGSNAEDLVSKIPGVTTDGGQVKAQGENVQRVYVDGKQFFGDDPMIALRNLPADVVDKVQIYDRMSDQSQFTGFDDGNTSKVMNILTRMGKRNSRFGKLYGGYGTEDRFSTGATINMFEGDRRVSLIGLGNNVNKQNFSPQDILGLTGINLPSGMLRGFQAADRMFGFSGGGGRGFGGGGGGGGGPFGQMGNFLVGSQDGNTRTYSVGVNYNDNWTADAQVNASYFFNESKNSTTQTLNRQYSQAQAFTQLYDEQNSSSSDNFNHRLNMRLEYQIDSSNSLIFSPRFLLQDNQASGLLYGMNTMSTGPKISATDYSSSTTTNGYNYSADFLLRHKFELPGRTISLNINPGANNKTIDGSKKSYNNYYKISPLTSDTTEILDQRLTQDVKSQNLSSSLNYTEPLSTSGQLQFTLSSSLNTDNSDKKTNNLDTASGLYNLLDAPTTNVFENKYSTQRAGAAYRYRTESFNIMAGVNYQRSHLTGTQQYPIEYSVDKTYTSIVPNARIQFRFSKTENLRINYSLNINPPSVSQLQNTVDNSNPLYLKTGNPDLNEESAHRLVFQFMSTKPESGSNLFAMLFLGYTRNPISNETFAFIRDTTLFSGYKVAPGTQFNMPINLDRSFSVRSFLNYGFMVTPIHSNLNLNASVNYSKTPGRYNGVDNESVTYALMGGFMLTSNISEDADYRIAYNPTYNMAKNSNLKSLDNNYIVHSALMGFQFTIIGQTFIKSDFNYYFNGGITDGSKKDYYLWNAGLGTRMFENNTGELRLEVFDILDQNRSLSKNVTESYIESKTVNVLQRYFLLTFTYSFKVAAE